MTDESLALIAFFRHLTAAFHLYPVLRRSRFLTGEINPDIEVKEVSWIDASGAEMTVEAWDNSLTRCFGMLLDGRGQATGIKKRGADTSLLIVFNAHHDIVEFTLPPSYETAGWMLLMDTSDPTLPASPFEVGSVCTVAGRSLLLFERIPALVEKIEEALESLVASTIADAVAQ
jgi:glycogen operon protein